jgi:hypothetical protein
VSFLLSLDDFPRYNRCQPKFLPYEKNKTICFYILIYSVKWFKFWIITLLGVKTLKTELRPQSLNWKTVPVFGLVFGQIWFHHTSRKILFTEVACQSCAHSKCPVPPNRKNSGDFEEERLLHQLPGQERQFFYCKDPIPCSILLNILNGNKMGANFGIQIVFRAQLNVLVEYLIETHGKLYVWLL